jgi:hypothetical protein
MNFITKHSLLLFIATFILLLVVAFFYIFHPRETVKEIKSVRIDTVTTLVPEIKLIEKRDTVVRWFEKPVKEMKQPETIYVQKVDSVFVIKYKDYDLVISVSKKANKDLDIFVLNQQNEVLKEYVYHNVGDVFDITSQENAIAVKSQFLEWNSIGAYGIHGSALNWKQHSFELGIKTGVNYLDKFTLDAKVGYDFNLKALRLSEELSYYPLR